MANLNIKLNAYFSPKIPKHMIKIDNVSSEALWFCSHDVLEYIKSLGVKKDSYIGLIGGNHLYIKPDGTLDGYGVLSEIVLSNDDFLSSEIEIIQKESAITKILELKKDDIIKKLEEDTSSFEKILYQCGVLSLAIDKANDIHVSQKKLKEKRLQPHLKEVFDEAKEIYQKSEISKDKTQLFQFSEEDTLMLIEKVFGNQEYISFSK